MLCNFYKHRFLTCTKKEPRRALGNVSHRETYLYFDIKSYNAIYLL